MEEVLDDPVPSDPEQAGIVQLIRQFPGIADVPLEVIPDGQWGGEVELFAALMSASGGDLGKIPEPLKPFYSRFMEEAPSSLAQVRNPIQAIPEGAFDEIEAILGESTSFFIGERVGVDQASGDIQISDTAMDAIRTRAREIGLDPEQTIKDVLRILGIDF